MGDVRDEGVFGLQRGFKKAGAETLMMSLWKVDDNATQRMMTAFYRNILAGKNKFEAHKAARQEVMDAGYTDPYFWASFIMLD